MISISLVDPFDCMLISISISGLPEVTRVVADEMGGDFVHVVEKVVSADINLPDSHLIDKSGCYRFPDSSRAAHRRRDIKLQIQMIYEFSHGMD